MASRAKENTLSMRSREESVNFYQVSMFCITLFLKRRSEGVIGCRPWKTKVGVPLSTEVLCTKTARST